MAKAVLRGDPDAREVVRHAAKQLLQGVLPGRD